MGGMLTFFGLAHLRDATLMHVLLHLRTVVMLSWQDLLLHLHTVVMLRWQDLLLQQTDSQWLGLKNFLPNLTEKWRLWWGQRWVHLCDVVVTNMYGNVSSKLVHHWACWKSWPSWWKTTKPTTVEKNRIKRAAGKTKKTPGASRAGDLVSYTYLKFVSNDAWGDDPQWHFFPRGDIFRTKHPCSSKIHEISQPARLDFRRLFHCEPSWFYSLSWLGFMVMKT